MPRDLRPIDPSPLSETEARTLRFLLDKSAQSQPEALEQRAKERALERKLRAKREAMAREEGRRSEELATLRINIDTVSAKIHELAPSGVAWRFVDEGLQKLATLAPSQGFFGTRSDNLDRDQIMLLAEIGLAVFEASTKQKSGPSLREKMQGVEINIGPSPPEGPGSPSDGRAQLAAAIVNAGRKRRGEV
jgi:hypothetical protein